MDKLINLVQKHFLVSTLILSFLIFGNSLINDFVADDRIQILGNPIVHSISNLPLFFSGSTFGDGYGGIRGNFYKPIMTTIYAFIYTLFGPTPFFYHFVQIIIHAINGFLVFNILQKFFSPKLSLAAALIFLVHPINTETVIYIASLQDVLFMCFGLIALYFLFYKPQLKYKALYISGLLVLSLLSKEAGLLFLPLIVLYCWLYNRKELFIYIISTVSVLLGYVILKYGLLKIGLTMDTFAPISRLPLQQRLLHIPLLLMFYFTTFFFPRDLIMLQNWVIGEPNLSNFYFPLLFCVFGLALIALLYYYIRKNKEQKTLFIFFTIWMLLGLGIHMQFHALDSTVTDHWFYFPMIGVLGLLLIAVQELLKKHKKYSTKAMYAFIILLLILSFRSFIRTFDWRNEYTLSKHDLQTQEDNFVLHGLYGLSLLNQGKWNEAEKHFIRATQIDKGNNMSWHNLGYLYDQKGQKEDPKYYQKSKEYYQKAIETGHNPTSYVNLASVMLFKSQDDFQNTEKFIATALKRYPNNPNLLVMHAITLQKLNRRDEAVREAAKAVKINPNNQQFVQVYYWISNNQEIKLTP